MRSRDAPVFRGCGFPPARLFAGNITVCTPIFNIDREVAYHFFDEIKRNPKRGDVTEARLKANILSQKNFPRGGSRKERPQFRIPAYDPCMNHRGAIINLNGERGDIPDAWNLVNLGGWDGLKSTPL